MSIKEKEERKEKKSKFKTSNPDCKDAQMGDLKVTICPDSHDNENNIKTVKQDIKLAKKAIGSIIHWVVNLNKRSAAAIHSGNDKKNLEKIFKTELYDQYDQYISNNE